MKIGNMEVYGVIYKLENKVNKKVYIGQTINKNGVFGRYSGSKKSRLDGSIFLNYHSKNKTKGRTYNEHLLNSLLYYGVDKFELNPIKDIAFSQEELDIKEKLWINIYNSNDGRFGYNNSTGGNEGTNYNEELGREHSKDLIGFDLDLYKEDIIKYYNEGKTLKEVGDKFGVSDTTIQRRLRKWGVPTRNNSIASLNFDIYKYEKEIIEYYKNGLTMLEIASKYGLKTDTSIKAVLTKNKIELRRRKDKKMDYSNLKVFDTNGNLLETFSSKREGALWLMEQGFCNSIENASGRIYKSIKSNKIIFKKYKFVI